MRLLQGKTAIITGGSRGIGRQIVETFLEHGACVHYFSRTHGDSLKYFQGLFSQADVVHHSVDVSTEKDVQKTVADIIAQESSVDIVVNNAGITRDGLMMRMSSEDWKAVIDTNLSSAFFVSRAVMRHMIKRRAGSIINISSVVGKIGNAGQVNYAASKAGLIGFTKSFAREVASRNVRVNAIAPGFINTEMTEKLTEDQQKTLISQIPLGRVGNTKDVAEACLFLASDMSQYITGEVLTVSGGLGM